MGDINLKKNYMRGGEPQILFHIQASIWVQIRNDNTYITKFVAINKLIQKTNKLYMKTILENVDSKMVQQLHDAH